MAGRIFLLRDGAGVEVTFPCRLTPGRDPGETRPRPGRDEAETRARRGRDEGDARARRDRDGGIAAAWGAGIKMSGQHGLTEKMQKCQKFNNAVMPMPRPPARDPPMQ